MKIALLELLEILRHTYVEIPEDLNPEKVTDLAQEKITLPENSKTPPPAKQKKAAIVEKVWQLMEKDGKKAEDVAIELGLSKVTIYRYHIQAKRQKQQIFINARPKLDLIELEKEKEPEAPAKTFKAKKWECVKCKTFFAGEIFYNADNQIICKKCHQSRGQKVNIPLQVQKA